LNKNQINSLYDSASALQILGCTMKHPNLIINSDGKYTFTEDDFVPEIHKIAFGALYNLAIMGTTNITVQVIYDYLSDRPKSLGVFQASNGEELLTRAKEVADFAAFDFYYNRLKKYSLLRGYARAGVDVSEYYNFNNILNMKEKQEEQERFDSLTLTELADEIDNSIMRVRNIYVDNSLEESYTIGDNILELVESLKETPEMGLPLYGDICNTVTRGARLGCLYLRSAATGVGKSRSLLADSCYMACPEIYNNSTQEWENHGSPQPSLFISTELELRELQTMALAFISGIPENRILDGELHFDEEDRLKKAIGLLQNAPLYIELLPNFSVKDIENCIKRNLRINRVQYIFFDYLSTSLGILEEVGRRTRGVAMREDSILFLISTKLKEIAVQFNIFIMTATQLNMDWKTDPLPDQNLLRGAKSIADKTDFGSILLNSTEKDEQMLAPIIQELGCSMPNVKLSVYKNRRGSIVQSYI